MSQRQHGPESPSELEIIEEEFNLLAEAWVASEDAKRRRRFLKAFGALLSSDRRPTLAGLHDIDPNSPVAQEARRRLQEKLALWTARYGD